MAVTYTPIATTTLATAASSYTFSSIPSTYTDLILVMTNINSGIDDIQLNFNGDVSTNYSRTYLEGNGSAAGTSRISNYTKAQVGYFPTSANGGISTSQIMNYSNATTYKTLLNRFNTNGVLSGLSVGMWRSLSAINSIALSPQSSSFGVGCTFSLYGIKAA